MKRKSLFLILAFCFVAVAIVGSLYLIPSTREQALTSYKDKEYNKALALYEKAYAEGSLQLDTVMHLVGVYLQYAEVEKAIEVMERFVEEHPDHIQARQELGRLYQYGQRPEDYLRNLEIINTLSASEEHGRKLSEAYTVTQEIEKQIPLMITRLMEENQGNAQEFRDLIRLLAAGQRFNEALDVQTRFHERFPNDLTFSDHELALSLYADTQQRETVQQYAMQLHGFPMKPEEIARVTNILLYRVNSEAAYDFIIHYKQEIAENTALFAQLITILTNTGQQKQAYALAYDRYEQGTLATELYDDLLLLASFAGNEELVSDLREKIYYDRLDENELIALVELAISRNDALLMAKLRERATRLAEQSNDFYLSAIIIIADRNKVAEDRVAEVLRKEPTFSRRLQLALLCAEKGFNRCVDAFHETLPPADSLSEAEIIAIARVLDASGKPEEAYEYINAARDHSVSPALDAAWFPLAAAYGDAETTTAFLDTRSELLSFSTYHDAYYRALDQRNTANAILIAEMLYGQEESEEHKEFVIQAYVQAHRYEEALPMLREVRDTSDQAERDYLYVLSKLARDDETYAEELGAYGIHILNQGAEPKRRQTIIYALTDAGQQNRIMPYVKDLAMQRPNEWAFLYADYLKQSAGSKQEALFWRDVAARHPNNQELHTQIAYRLLEQGSKEEAIAMFREQAEDEAPDSQIVSQLLYLWGPVYPEEGIQWLLARADSADTMAERQAWLKRAVNGSSDEHLIQRIRTTPQLLEASEIEQRYVAAISRTVPQEEIPAAVTNYLAPRIETAQETESLLRYAELAQAYRLDGLEQKAYTQALAMNPDHPKTLARAGVAAYGDADYSQARQLLSHYFTLDVPTATASAETYRPHFYYAEALRREGKHKEARAHYREIVAAGSAVDESDHAFHSMAARALAFSGQEDKGLEIYRRLIETFPENRQLRADYSSTLIELDQPEAARASLAAWKTPMAPTTGEALPLSLSNLKVSAYRLIDGGDKVLLRHEPGNTPLIPLEREGYAWLAYATEGHSETLLATTSNYQLEVMHNQQTGTWLHPVRTEDAQLALLNDDYAIQNELMHARIEVETGEAYEASQRVRPLVQQYSENPQVLGFSANVENYIGNWPYARKLIDRAHALQPHNEDIIELQRSIERLHASNVYLDGEWRSLDDNDEFITTIGGVYDINETMQVGIEVQNDSVDSATLRLPDGRQDTFDVERQRGELFLRHFDDDGAQAQVSLFANNDTAGLGAYYRFVNRFGFTRLGVEYHRPYWEFVEGVIDNATRDRLKIGHRYTPENDIIIDGTLAYNRYNTAFDDDLSSTVSIGGTVSHAFHEEPYLAVGYGLDAEYEIDEDNGVDANGIPFQRFPLDSREVHSILLFGNHNFSLDTNAEGLISYGFDRISGDSGPAAEGRLTHYLTDDLSIQGRASYGFRGGADDGDVTRAGIRLQYRY